MSSHDERPVALTVAGSDSGGGAGIQADLKTFEAFGVFGTSAITAVTAQNTLGVTAIQKIDPAVIAGQIEAVFSDLSPAAMKTGMLTDRVTIEVVAEVLARDARPAYVLDPVMVAKGGAKLLEDDAFEALTRSLLPLADIVTPNLPEAARLTGRDLGSSDELRSAADAILQLGPRSVLIKGGHLPGETVTDVFYDGQHFEEWTADRIDTRHTHGTGCTLSAAICAGLALGQPLALAVGRARLYTRRAIETAPGLGSGHGPLNHKAAIDDTS